MRCPTRRQNVGLIRQFRRKVRVRIKTCGTTRFARPLLTSIGIATALFSISTICAPSSSYALDMSDFSVIGGGALTLGSVKNSDDSIQGRLTGAVNLHALPGYKISQFTAGVMAQYRFVGQLVHPSSVGNTNMGAHGYYLGPGGSFQMGPWLFQASIDLLGSDTLFNGTASGDGDSFSQPLGFTLIAGYALLPQFPKLTVDGYFGMHSFSHQTLGSTEVDISSNKLTEIQGGVGASYAFY